MGMSASQVRFLSLQSRKNNIGLNLMTLSNRRTALSRDMKRVAANYNNAMNQKLLKWTNDSGMTYNDINYDLLMKPNAMNSTLPYIVTDAQGRVVLDNNNIILDGEDTLVSYRDLATMISTYSGVENGLTTYTNTSNLSGTGSVEQDENGNVTDIHSANVNGGAANEENPYQIVSSTTNMQAGSLQYDVMQKLGLLTNDEVAEIKNTVIGLYGTDTDNGGPYPVTSLMGQYYFACAKLEAYQAFQNEVSTYVMAGMKTDGNQTWTKYDTSTLSDVKKSVKNTISTVEFTLSNDRDTQAATYLNLIDFRAEANNYSPEAQALYENGNLFTNNSNTPPSLVYEVTNYNDNVGADIKFTFKKSTSLKDLLSNAQIGDVANTYQDTVYFGGQIDEPKSTDNWSKLFTDNMSISLYTTEQNGGAIVNNGNHSNDITSETLNHLIGWINGFGNVIKEKFPDADEEALNLATRLTLQTFWGQLGVDYDTNYAGGSNGHNVYEYCSHTHDVVTAPCDVDCIMEEVVNTAKDQNNIFNKYTHDVGLGFTVIAQTYAHYWDPYDLTAVAVNAKNLISTFLTYYNVAATNKTLDDTDINGYHNGTVDRAENKEPTAFNYKGDIYNETNISYSDTEVKVNILSKKPLADGSGYELTVVYKEIDDTKLINDASDSNKKYKNISYTTYKIYEDNDGIYYIDEDMHDREIINSGMLNNGKIIQKVVETYQVEKIDGATSDNPSDYKFIDNIIHRQDIITYNDDKKCESFMRIGRFDEKYWYGKTLYSDPGNGTNYIDANYEGEGGIKYYDIGNFKGINPNTGKPFIYECDSDGNVGSVDTSGNINMFINYSGQDITEARINNMKASSIYATDYIQGKVNVQEEIDALTRAKEDALNAVNEAKANMDTLLMSKQSKIMDYFNALFKMISERGWVYDENVNNKTNPSASQQYLNAKLQNNLFFITEVESVNGEDFDYATKVVNNVSRVIEIYDEDASNVALSQYEAEKADITAKEKVIDMRISKLEAEEEAITTEMDSLKTIINDNVQNTFKIFS